jgi:hypothetical protein
MLWHPTRLFSRENQCICAQYRRIHEQPKGVYSEEYVNGWRDLYLLGCKTVDSQVFTSRGRRLVLTYLGREIPHNWPLFTLIEHKGHLQTLR